MATSQQNFFNVCSLSIGHNSSIHATLKLINDMSKENKNLDKHELGNDVIADVGVSLLCEFADYILHNANWSESFADQPWYSETLERNVSSEELSRLFLNSR